MVVIYNFFSFVVLLFIFVLIMFFIFGYCLDWFLMSGIVIVGLVEGMWLYYLDKLKYLILLGVI